MFKIMKKNPQENRSNRVEVRYLIGGHVPGLLGTPSTRREYHLQFEKKNNNSLIYQSTGIGMYNRYHRNTIS